MEVAIVVIVVIFWLVLWQHTANEKAKREEHERTSHLERLRDEANALGRQKCYKAALEWVYYSADQIVVQQDDLLDEESYWKHTLSYLVPSLSGTEIDSFFALLPKAIEDRKNGKAQCLHKDIVAASILWAECMAFGFEEQHRGASVYIFDVEGWGTSTVEGWKEVTREILRSFSDEDINVMFLAFTRAMKVEGMSRGLSFD